MYAEEQWNVHSWTMFICLKSNFLIFPAKNGVIAQK